MKISTVIIFLTTLQLTANSYSQSLNVDIKNGSLSDVFQTIESQTDYTIFYKDNHVNSNMPVDLKIKGGNIKKVLDLALDGSNIRYSIIDNIIVLLPKKPSNQELTVKGRIIDIEGNPLPGVNIVEKGTTNGTVTNLDGEYIISISSPQAVLSFSYVGFLTEDVEVSGKTTIDITMIEDITSLDEVVVVGYGTMKRSDLTGSVISVSSEDIKKNVSTSFDQVLEGRAAGLIVTQNSGQPGGGVSVRIRGVNSLTQGNEPLYVVDGVPLSNIGMGAARASGSDGSSSGVNPLTTISPSDIESIEILKDASSAAIYGSRAANGVILITTKKGKKGKPEINYECYFALQQIPTKLDMMNLRQYAKYDNEKSDILGIARQPQFKNPSMLGEGTDWQKELFNTAPMYSHHVSATGGNEQIIYALSLGYVNQDGIAKGSGFERYTVNLNLENQTTDWMKIGSNLALGRTNENLTATTANNLLTINRNLIGTALNMPPDIAVKNPNGTWGGYSLEQAERGGGAIFVSPNPVALSELIDNELRRFTLVGNIYADVSLAKGLKLRNEFDMNMSYSNQNQFVPTYDFGAKVNPTNWAQKNADNSLFWSIKNYVTYTNSFQSELNLTVTAGHEANLSRWEGFNSSIENFPTNYIPEFALGDNETTLNDSYKGEDALESYFGRISFSLKDKYLVTASFRADGSSKFGPNNRWGYFPSAAVAWNLSNEQFLANVSQINNLKLRFSYGAVGNSNIASSTYIPVLSAVTTHWGTGFLTSNYPNPDVKWESTKSGNLGLDLYMFGNRLEFMFDAYIKKTDNLLLELPMPLYAGTSGSGNITPPTVNLGELENKGFEFTLSTVNISQELFWKTSFSFSLNRNKVLKLNSENGVLDESLYYTSVYTRTAVDKSVGLFYGYVSDGIFETGEEVLNSALPKGVNIDKDNGVWVGDVKYKDISGDGVIDENDRTYLGDPNPDWIASMNNTFNYKNFDLSIFISGVYGNKIFNGLKYSYGTPSTGNKGLLATVTNYAKPALIDPNLPETIENSCLENPGTKVFRLAANDVNGNDRMSDMYLEDGAYLRVKNITMGYSIPTKLLGKINIKDLRLFCAIQNVITLTNYSGYDPEIGSIQSGSSGNMLLSGVDVLRYPSPRIYTFGININF